MENKDFKYDLIKRYAVLTTHKGGEPRLVFQHGSWNGNTPKYEIRELGPDGKPWKGNSLTDENLKELHRVIGKLIEDEIIS